jgi:hypothetical protein
MTCSQLKGAKFGFVTHGVANAEMHDVRMLADPPAVGDLVVGKVVTIGVHKAIENRESRRSGIFVGDLIVGAFGNRYATDQFEALVPESVPEIYDIVSVGAVCGHVVAKNLIHVVEEPTKLRMLGSIVDHRGRKLNIRDHRLRAKEVTGATPPKVIVVVGSSMNSGKTTAVANTVRGLSSAGYRVCAAKITGTACSKDTWLMHDAGALAILDFSDCGLPSTYLISRDELLDTYETLYSNLVAHEPDCILFEIADGIFQRETDMLLREPTFRTRVDRVLFTGADALACESGTRILRQLGYQVVAVSGLVSGSRLGMKEVVAATGLPCLDAEMLCTGGLLGPLGIGPR